MKIIFFIYFFCTGFTELVCAQQWSAISKSETQQIFLGIEHWFTNHQSYSVNIYHTLYVGYKYNDVPCETWNGFLIMDKDCYHSDLLGLQTIENQQYHLLIDTGNRLIVVSDPQHIEKSMLESLDSMALHSMSAYWINIQSSTKTLRLDFTPGHRLEREEITYDSLFRLQQIIFYFSGDRDESFGSELLSDKPKLVICYSKYLIDTPVNRLIEFSVKPYLADSSGKLLLTSSYHNYRLIDTRLSK